MSGTITAPYAGFVGLAVGGIEVSGGSYIREPVNLVTSADGITLANDATIEWPIATTDWGTVDHVQIWDAPTLGNAIVTLLTHTPVPVPQYAIARIPDAGITAVIGQTTPRKYSIGSFGVGPFSVWQELGTRMYGMGLFGVGPFSTSSYLAPNPIGEPSAFGVGGFGVGPYGIAPEGVLLEVTFDTSTHVCEPGTWTIVKLAA